MRALCGRLDCASSALLNALRIAVHQLDSTHVCVCVCGSWYCVYGVVYVLIDVAAKCKVQLHNIEWAIRNNSICGHLRKRHANGPPRRVP